MRSYINYLYMENIIYTMIGTLLKHCNIFEGLRPRVPFEPAILGEMVIAEIDSRSLFRAVGLAMMEIIIAIS